MYGNHTLTYSDLKISGKTLTITIKLDNRNLPIIIRLSETPALPAKVKHSIAADIGMAILADFAQIFLPKEIIIKIPYASEKLPFWIKSFKKTAAEKAFTEKLDFSLLDFPWKIINQQKIQKFSLNNDRDKIFLAQSGGKDSLTALKIFGNDQHLKLFFLEPSENSFRYQSFKVLSESYNFFFAETNLMKMYFELQQKFNSKFYSRFQTGLIVFISLLFSDQSPYILLANEYGANFKNTKYLASDINHQYQKSDEFAQDLNSYIDKFFTSDFKYYSPFFQIYEYLIMKLFLKNLKIPQLWTSCNNATDSKNFCGRCYKCAFLYILSLEHKSANFLAKIFPDGILDNLDLSKPLMDPQTIKVFDCVGEKKEVWVALANICKLGKEKDSKTIIYFKREIYPLIKNKFATYEAEVNSLQNVSIKLPHKLDKIIKANFRAYEK